MYERRTKRSFDVGGTSAAPPPPPAHDQYPWQGEHEDEPFPLFDHFDDTRKVAKSAACRNRAIGEAWDDYDSILYNVWLKVSIEPTWFVDPDVVRALGIRSDLEDLFVELGMGNFATHPQILYPELVRQFMKASESVLTFFICGIRYRVPLLTLCTIYGFETERQQRQHAIPRCYTVQRPGGPQPHRPEYTLPPFPPMPDMSTRPEGDFQRVVVDALTAIWARVSRCHCSSRRSVRASSPSAAGLSR
ncbi:hypothetical protein F2Q68_00005144 [Brassica cretica]|uniref:Arabidopsis retrotransposon Orf1 C-terminal domain-containing protein n=2 Tax=Brassica cretica TaxID=69181 RepID=A0ABQ7BZM0_BRACR|nr:hypothetical protein F2Q68_00005144 [Brassica cretica]KAF3544724.1 hypothetical protein DY000_02007796 [Brassica cretica]